jgi:hypothetical protein
MGDSPRGGHRSGPASYRPTWREFLTNQPQGIIMNEAPARQVLTAYERHHNEHRPHRARNQLPPGSDQQPIAGHQLEGRRLLRTRILGGIINEYRQAA